MRLRPLVVRFGALGDMVMALALIRALHRRYGVPVDVVSSGRATVALLQGQPGVGTLYLIRSRKTPYVLSPGQWRLVEQLRARGPTPTWICDSDDKCRWLVGRAGIPPSLIVDVRSYPFRAGEHAVDRWLRMARATPDALSGSAVAVLDFPFRAPPLVVDDGARADVEHWLAAQDLTGRPLVLIQPGSRRVAKRPKRRSRASNTKYWPEERWARVIDAIAELEPGVEILLTGVPAEYGLNAAILRYTKTTHVRNVADALPLGRLLALQELALGMISVDTGPAHTAAALGCPLVVLFGTAEPVRYSPRGPGSEAVVCLRGVIDGRLTMLGIDVDQVIGAWRELREVDFRRDAPAAAEASRA